MDADSREFMRELLLRHERATRSMIARLDAGTEALRRHTAEMQADHAKFHAEMRDQRGSAAGA